MNFALSSLRIGQSMKCDAKKATYFQLYKALHEKYIYVKTKRAEEWTSRGIELHIEREKVV